MSRNPVIQFQNVSLSMAAQQIHKEISFQICSGETVTILGPSGTGKTLILKMIIGLIRPTSGSVTVLDSDVHALSDEKLRLMRMNVGMLFQGAALFDSLTVFENVAYALREFGQQCSNPITETRIEETVQEKLEIVGLPGIGQKFPSQLSGGQRKRVGLARALASAPKIMLYDEPTTGLDPTTARRIDELMVTLRQQYRLTSIAVTHDIASARRISNRWILVDGGNILADGPVEDLIARNSEVQRFIEGRWRDQ